MLSIPFLGTDDRPETLLHLVLVEDICAYAALFAGRQYSTLDGLNTW